MYHQFTRAEAENILRSSEGAPTSHRGTGSPGHAGARHLLLSNTELLARYQRMSEQVIWQNGRRRRREYTLITAFCTLPAMIDAAELVLNAAQTQAALADFFHGTPRGPGMRAEIAFTSGTTFRMRYAQGVEAVRVHAGPRPHHGVQSGRRSAAIRSSGANVLRHAPGYSAQHRNDHYARRQPYRSHFVPV